MADQDASSPDRRGDVLDEAGTPPALDGLAPRKRGRPAGLGKVPGSGRKKGTPNHTTADAKALILARGKPIEFLCDVIQGRRVRVGPQAGPGEARYEYPSLTDRMRAAVALAAKVLPDVKATELSGPDGGAIQTDGTVHSDPLPGALRIAHLLGLPLSVGGRSVAVSDEALAELPEAAPAGDVSIPAHGCMDPDIETARRMAYALGAAGRDLAGYLGLSPASPPPPPAAVEPAPPAAPAPVLDSGDKFGAVTGDPAPTTVLGSGARPEAETPAPAPDPDLIDDGQPPARRRDEATVTVGETATLRFQPDLDRWAAIRIADHRVMCSFRRLEDCIRQVRVLMAAGAFDPPAADPPAPFARETVLGHAQPPRVFSSRSRT